MEKNQMQKKNIEVSVSCGLARITPSRVVLGAEGIFLRWCKWLVVVQQLIATNRCTKLQIAFPAWRAIHACSSPFPTTDVAFPLLTPLLRRESSISLLIFYDCLAPATPPSTRLPSAFLSSSFMAAKLNLHCNWLFGVDSAFSRFYGPEIQMKTHELCKPGPVDKDKDMEALGLSKKVPIKNHFLLI